MRAALLLPLVALAGCLGGGDALILGTTTTTVDTGLLDVLLPEFERDTGIRAQPVVGGTGEILEKAKRGDVEVILAHSPAREREMLAEGWTTARSPVMFNLFAIAGPEADPAGVRQATSAPDALARIRANASAFASRGDQSGTHEKELALWRDAGADPATLDRAWYKETGAGQGATLLFAEERGAYLLVDQGTLRQHHANGRAVGIIDLHHEDARLRNQYGVSLPDPARTGADHAEGARAFFSWITGARGQDAIASYVVDGAPLFTPNADDPEA